MCHHGEAWPRGFPKFCHKEPDPRKSGGELALEGSSSFGAQESARHRRHPSLLTECLPGHSSLQPTTPFKSIFLNNQRLRVHPLGGNMESGNQKSPERLCNSASWVLMGHEGPETGKVTSATWSAAEPRRDPGLPAHPHPGFCLLHRAAFPGNREPLQGHSMPGLRSSCKKDHILGSPKQNVRKYDLSGLLDLDPELLHLGLQYGYFLLKLVDKLRGAAQQGIVRSPTSPNRRENRATQTRRKAI